MDYVIQSKKVTSSAVAMIGRDQNDDIWILPNAGEWAYRYECKYLRQEILDVINSLFEESSSSISIGTLWSELKQPYKEQGIASEKLSRDDFFDSINKYKPVLKANPVWFQTGSGLFSW
jgi:hypothetical protein